MKASGGRDELVDALLIASRALVGVSARSLEGIDVTLAQYRAVVVVASRPGLTVGELAEALAVHPTTATRMCDRLVGKRLIRRVADPDDRRAIALHPAAAGRHLLERVATRRRREIAAIVDRLEPSASRHAIEGLEAFARAAGEVPLGAEVLGWDLGPGT